MFWRIYAAIGLIQSAIFVMEGVRGAKARMLEKRAAFTSHRCETHGETEEVARVHVDALMRSMTYQIIWRYTPLMVALSLVYTIIWPLSLSLRLYVWLGKAR